MNKVRKVMKRTLSLLLVLSVFLSSISVTAFASAGIELPEIGIEQNIAESGMFYIAHEAAQLYENAGAPYLFKIQRGGDELPEAAVVLNMIDVTAKYGKDYKVKIHNNSLFGERVESSDDNQSVLETIEENPDEVEEINYSDLIATGAITSEEDAEKIAAEDAEVLYEELGLTEDERAELTGEAEVSDENTEAPEAEAAEADENAEAAEEAPEAANVDTSAAVLEAPEADEAETAFSADTLKGAKEMATGARSDREPMQGGNKSIEKQLQLADMSMELNSARLKVEFAEGETEKVIEIIPIDNNDGDGSRVMQLFLAGSDENAIVSQYSGFTVSITDDEVQEDAVINLSDTVYTSKNGFVEVTLTREGAINQMVAATVKTEDITAEGGKSYSVVDTTVSFPYGIKERTIKIPVRPSYADDGSKFKISIDTPVGAHIGENYSAECVLTYEENAQDSEEADNAELLAEANVGSIITDENKVIKGKDAYSTGKNCDGSVSSDGDNLKIYSYCFWHNANSWAKYYSGSHYDYSGYRIKWEKNSGKPCWTDTWVDVYDMSKKEWRNFFSSTEERWGERPNDIFMDFDYSEDVQIKQRHRDGKSPTLTVKTITPILRPFEVTLVSAAPLKFLDENGNYVDNTYIEAVKEANQTILDKATDNGTGTVVKFSGQNITVKTQSKFAYIKGLQLVSDDNSKIRTVVDNLPVGTTSASVELTNKLIKNNLDIVSFSDNPGRGRKGSFKIKPILGYYDSSVTIEKDYRGEVKLYEANEANDALKEIVTGMTYRIRNKETGLYLTSNGEWKDVTQESKDTKNANYWTVKKNGGQYNLVASDGKYLNIPYDKTNNGSQIDTAPDNGHNSKKFLLNRNKDGSYSIVTYTTRGDKGLAVYQDKNTAGTKIHLWEYSDTNEYMKWFFEPVSPEEGYYYIKNVNSGLYLREAYSSIKTSNVYQTKHNENDESQIWKLSYVDGCVRLKNKSNHTLCVKDGKTGNGTRFDSSLKTKNDSQLFTLACNKDGSFGLLTKVTGGASCADISGGSKNDNAVLVQELFNNKPSQQWVFEKYGDPSSVEGKAPTDIKFHKGDTIKVSQTIFGEYQSAYTQSQIRMIIKANSDSTESGKAQDFDNGTNSYTFLNEFSYITFRPLFKNKSNAITVRVKTSDISKFDTSKGIFKSKSTKNGEYTDYTAVGSDKFVSNTYYDLTAVTNSTGDVAVWNPIHKSDKYSQETFYFEGLPNAEDNVIYLTAEKAADKPFTLTGTAYHASVALNGKSEGAGYIPASGMHILIGNRQYGIADEKGEFATIPANGIANYKVRYKVVAMGYDEYKTVTLSKSRTKTFEADGVSNSKKITAYDVRLGKLTVKESEVGAPDPTVTVTNSNNVQEGDSVTINDDISRFGVKIANNGRVYTDTDGVKRTENVIGVKFLVYDPISNTKKSEVATMTKEMDLGTYSVWKGSHTFEKGKRDEYSASDKLFIQLITDKVVGNGKSPEYDDKGNITGYKENPALMQTTYAPRFTGYTFSEANAQVPVVHDFTMPTSMGFVELPLIGNMTATFNIKGISLSVSELPGGGERLSVGYIKRSEETKKNDDTSDNGTAYGLTELKEAAKGVKEFGQQSNDLAALGMGSWGLSPIFGLYIDFGLEKIQNSDDVNYQFVFIGGGVYIGITGKFRLVQYFIIGPVPCYFGVEGELTVFANIGFRFHKSQEPLTPDMLKKQGGQLTDKVEYAATLQANGLVAAYVGVGLCGTLGVRGGIQFNAGYIYDNTIQESYPDVDENGLLLSADIKVWLDAFLFSIPIPAVNILDKKYGYYAAMDGVDLFSAADGESGLGEPVLRKTNSENAKWVAPSENDAELLATFEQSRTDTLIENGYDHADPQLIALGDDRFMTVFVGDAGSGRDEYNKTAVMYSVYNGTAWTEPVIIQKDDTADFEPNVIDAGDKVLVTWTSRKSADGTGANEFIKGLEVYAVTINKSTLEMGEIEQLTDDDFYDSAPVAMYDGQTGDMAVYYLKSDVKDDEEFATAVSPTVNESVIVYMLYDNATGRWVRDEYFENELADMNDAAVLIEKYHGQRFLASPLANFGANPDGVMNDPIIMDFDAISYNGIGVYTYTVDEDNNMDTTGDRELFVQFYDFASHKTYVPVRITNDGVADARPQLVRNGDNTYLFWLQNEKDVRYVNISNLVKNGVNDDGTIKEDYEIEQSVVFFTNNLGDDINPTFGSFKPYVDSEGNLFIVWLQPVTSTDDDGKMTSCQEVYASAYIPEVTEEGANGEDGEEQAKSGSWSSGVRLTNSNAFNDEVAFVTDNSGNLIVINNQYDMNLAEQSVKNMKLVATKFKTVGSVEVASVEYENNAPLEDSDNEVTIKLINNGLKTAHGYTINVYECINGVKGEQPIYTNTSTQAIFASNMAKEVFTWKMPYDLTSNESTALYITVQEAGMNEIHEFTSEPVTVKAVYEITDYSVSDDADGTNVTYTITNVGNKPSSMPVVDEESDEIKGDKVVVAFNDIYHTGTKYDVFMEMFIGELGVGESRTYTGEVKIPEEAFIRNYVNVYMQAQDEKNESISTEKTFIITLNRPMDVVINGDAQLESIEVKQGAKTKVNAAFTQEDLFADGSVQLDVEDTSIAYIDDEGNLVGNAAGTTVLTATVLPYGTTKSIAVEVKKKSTGSSGGGGSSSGLKVTPTPSPSATPAPSTTPEPSSTSAPSTTPVPSAREFDDVAQNAWYAEPINFVTSRAIFNGTSTRTFEPETGMTRGMMVQVLYNLENNPKVTTKATFKDIQGHWSADAVNWASAKGVVTGYDADTFGADDILTREQLAAILHRYAGKPTSTADLSKFGDSASISEYAVEPVRWTVESSIIGGMDDNTLQPQGTATRAQVSAMMMRYMMNVK